MRALSTTATISSFKYFSATSKIFLRMDIRITSMMNGLISAWPCFYSICTRFPISCSINGYIASKWANIDAEMALVTVWTPTFSFFLSHQPTPFSIIVRLYASAPRFISGVFRRGLNSWMYFSIDKQFIFQLKPALWLDYSKRDFDKCKDFRRFVFFPVTSTIG